VTSPIEGDLSPVRLRVAAYAQRHALSECRSDLLVEVAADHVGLTLSHLKIATDDAVEAEAEYVRAQGAFSAGTAPGMTTIEGEQLQTWLLSRRAYFLLHYRIDTFYVFARVLLDDIAALVNEALPRSKGRQIGKKHKGVVRSLEAITTDEDVSGWEPVATRARDLTERVKDFRDDYVVHRSSAKPRTLRSMVLSPEGTARMSVGGVIYPTESDEVRQLASEDPRELMAALEGYVDAVLDLLEQPELSPDSIS
jgi:hypothetical protein